MALPADALTNGGYSPLAFYVRAGQQFIPMATALTFNTGKRGSELAAKAGAVFMISPETSPCAKDVDAWVFLVSREAVVDSGRTFAIRDDFFSGQITGRKVEASGRTWICAD